MKCIYTYEKYIPRRDEGRRGGSVASARSDDAEKSLGNSAALQIGGHKIQFSGRNRERERGRVAVDSCRERKCKATKKSYEISSVLGCSKLPPFYSYSFRW